MKTRRELERHLEEIGELLDRHTGGRADYSEYADDPVGFIADVLGGELWARQVEIAEAFRDEPLVAVRSANGIGKDFLAARLALWWCYARQGLAIVTGPTLRQVKEIVMGEVRHAWTRAGDLPGELFEFALRLNRTLPSGILAFTSTEASKKTGFHAPALAVFITEAQGVEADTYEAALSNATGEHSRILAVGNPLTRGCRFYSCFGDESAWTGFRVPAFEHPNLQEDREVIPGAVTRQFVERIRTEYGTTSSQYEARVLAEFPTTDEQMLTSWEAVEAVQGQHRRERLEGETEGLPLVLGVDVARYGSDTSVLVCRHGPIVREFQAWGRASTVESVEIVREHAIRLHADWGPPAHRWNESVTVVVDEIGVGGGVVDGLRDIGGLRVIAFNSGSSAGNPDRFLNARSEAYWRVRQRIERGEIALPEDPELVEELTSTRWELTDSGKIRIEPKDAIKARIGRSPDRADALAMALTHRPLSVDVTDCLMV